LGNHDFAKSKRLLTAQDFSLVFNANKAIKLKASDRHFMILAKATDSTECRIGFAVAKKKIKLAVSRNRIKRIVREQFRLNENTLGLDLVIMANTPCVKASNADLVKSYHLLWEKLQQQYKKLSLS
jgi:ribonuclease P protein component